MINKLLFTIRWAVFKLHTRESSWSYGSWIYHYLCNQCISPL